MKIKKIKINKKKKVVASKETPNLTKYSSPVIWPKQSITYDSQEEDFPSDLVFYSQY